MKTAHFLTVLVVILSFSLVAIATIFARNLPAQINPAETREP